MNTAIKLCLWGCLSGLLFICPAYAQTPTCSDLYRQKKFLPAGKCFERKANAMGESKQLSKIQRYLKGQSLRNAALSYRKAGQAEQNAEKAVYRYEQALLILQRYLKENLCQKQYLCRLAKGESLELLNQIKYVQLSIVTSPNKRAIVRIQGFKYKIQHFSPPQWNKRIRPGRYTVRVKYEGQKVIVREIIATPGKALTIALLAPTPVVVRRRPSIPRTSVVRIRPLPRKPKVVQHKTSAFPFVIAGAGVLVAGVGAALLIYGQSQIGTRDEALKKIQSDISGANTPKARIEKVDENSFQALRTQMDTAHKNAASVLLPGWILVGVGGATLLTGLGLHGAEKIAHRNKRKTAPPKVSKTGQTFLNIR